MEVSLNLKQRGILLSVAPDILRSVTSFLAVRDFVRTRQTCRHLNSRADDDFYWKDFIDRQLLPPLESSDFRVPNGIYERSEVTAKSILMYLKAGEILSLIDGVEKCSSIDHTGEKPENVLRKSLCLSLYAHGSLIPQAADLEQQQLGMFLQMQCGCCNGRPCYWSSQPSSVQTAEEFIDFKLLRYTSFITGITITPYCAFFHPECPVYGPQFAILQFLVPDHEDEDEGPDGGDGGAATALSRESGESGRNEPFYYQTAPLAIGNVASPQIVLLPRPVLCLGGRVRLLLRGMHQRQTLTEEEGGPHHDDYYMCLSHFEIFGVPVDDDPDDGEREFLGSVPMDDHQHHTHGMDLYERFLLS